MKLYMEKKYLHLMCPCVSCNFYCKKKRRNETKKSTLTRIIVDEILFPLFLLPFRQKFTLIFLFFSEHSSFTLTLSLHSKNMFLYLLFSLPFYLFIAFLLYLQSLLSHSHSISSLNHILSLLSYHIRFTSLSLSFLITLDLHLSLSRSLSLFHSLSLLSITHSLSLFYSLSLIPLNSNPPN